MKTIKISAFLFSVLICSGCIQPKKNTTFIPVKQLSLHVSKRREIKPITDSTNIPLIRAIEPKAAGIVIYSGACTLYKKHTIEDGGVKYVPSRNAFAKVVINNLAKKFSFFFNGKLIFTQHKYISYHDDIQGGIGFPLDGDFSAHLFTVDKTFKIYDQAGTYGSKDSFIGYEYEIANYRTKLN